MSLRIEFIQRTPLILAAAVIAISAGSLFSNDSTQPAKPVWERTAGVQFEAVSFEAPQGQPAFAHQQDAKPAPLLSLPTLTIRQNLARPLNAGSFSISGEALTVGSGRPMVRPDPQYQERAGSLEPGYWLNKKN